MPLALVGGLDTRAKLEEALAAGFPYVSLSRSLICDPDFVNKLREGQTDVSSCLRCNGCYQCYRTRHTRCVTHKEALPRLAETFG
jgi:2,4-dienoyl-CoA reductase-like NADH-dependent reductase (Old Yellow Enzyme family)